MDFTVAVSTSENGLAMTKAVSRWPLRFRGRVCPRRIGVGQNGTGTGIIPPWLSLHICHMDDEKYFRWSVKQRLIIRDLMCCLIRNYKLSNILRYIVYKIYSE
jgi:hypothetical protein